MSLTHSTLLLLLTLSASGFMSYLQGIQSLHMHLFEGAAADRLSSLSSLSCSLPHQRLILILRKTKRERQEGSNPLTLLVQPEACPGAMPASLSLKSMMLDEAHAPMLHEYSALAKGVHKVVADDQVKAVPAVGVHVIRQHHSSAHRMEVRLEADNGRAVLVCPAALPLC